LLEPPKFRSDTMTFVKTLCSPKPSAASAGPDPRQACPWGTSRRCRRSRTRSPGWVCPAPSPHPGQHASCSSLSRPPTSLPKLGPLCSAHPPVCRDMPRFLAEWHTRRFKRRRRFFLFVDRQEPPHPILRTHLNTSRGAEGWNPTPSPSEIGIGDRRWGGGQGRGCPRWRPPSTPAGFSLTSAACTRPIPRPPNLLTGLFGVCGQSWTFPPVFFVCARCSLFLTVLQVFISGVVHFFARWIFFFT